MGTLDHFFVLFGNLELRHVHVGESEVYISRERSVGGVSQLVNQFVHKFGTKGDEEGLNVKSRKVQSLVENFQFPIHGNAPVLCAKRFVNEQNHCLHIN